MLSAIETVNPKLRSTLDAAALCKMADRGQITGGLLDGPLAFDNAVSPRQRPRKGIVSQGRRQRRYSGRSRSRIRQYAGKAAHFLAGADAAGVVLGARVPIILTSRADARAHSHGLLRRRSADRTRRAKAAQTAVGV